METSPEDRVIPAERAIPLLQQILPLGTSLLEEQPIERVLGLEVGIPSTKFLDSSWLFWALDSLVRNWENVAQSDTRGVESVDDLPRPFFDFSAAKNWNSANDTVRRFAYYYYHNDFDEGLFTKLAKWPDLVSDNKYRKSRKRIVKGLANFFFGICQRAMVWRKIRLVTIKLYNIGLFDQSLLKSAWRSRGVLPIDDVLAESSRGEICPQSRLALYRMFWKLLEKTETPWPARLNKAAAAYLTMAAPVAHFELRKTYLKRANRVARLFPAKKLFTILGSSNTPSVFMLAAYCQNGTKIIGGQHGGNYGYTKIAAASIQIEAQVYNDYISWGWDRWPQVIGKTKTPVSAVGSFYLRELSIDYKKRIAEKKPPQDRVLFCPVGFTNKQMRLHNFYNVKTATSDFWPLSAKLLADFVAKTQCQLDIKLYRNADSIPFMNLLNETFDERGLKVNFIDVNTPANRLFHQYSVAIWDTVTTGFLETTSLRMTSFLLPLARIRPILIDGVSISDKFFLDKIDATPHNLEQIFSEAMSESSSFFAGFAHQAPISFENWVGGLKD